MGSACLVPSREARNAYVIGYFSKGIITILPWLREVVNLGFLERSKRTIIFGDFNSFRANKENFF